MIILFTNDEDRFNAVDHKNVFVGYSLYQQCCENAGWYIHPSENLDTSLHGNILLPSGNVGPGEQTLDDYEFDVDTLNRSGCRVERDDGTDDTFYCVFPLINTVSGDRAYLILFNCHNGYYSHGWRYGTIDLATGEATETVVRDGSI